MRKTAIFIVLLCIGLKLYSQKGASSSVSSTYSSDTALIHQTLAIMRNCVVKADFEQALFYSKRARMLAQLLNINYNKNLQLEKLPVEQYSISYDESPEQIYQTATQSLAMIKFADLMEKSARTQIKCIRSGYYPSIYLRGSLSSNFSSPAYKTEYFNQVDNNLGKSVNVSVVIPLFNSFRTKNAVSIAKLNHRETQLLAQSARTELQQLIEQAYFNMIDAKDRYNVFKEQVAAFSESFKAADSRFNLGAMNSVDYLVSKNNLEKAKINFVVAGYDFILRKKILDFYQGKPLF